MTVFLIGGKKFCLAGGGCAKSPNELNGKINRLSDKIGKVLVSSDGLTQEALHNAGVAVAEHEGVGGGLQVGGVHVDLLDVDVGDGVELVHEQDEVTHVNVVAHAVNNEEEVTPVLGGFDSQWCGQGFVLLIILLNLILGLCCLLFWLLFLGLLLLVFLRIFLGLLFLVFLLFLWLLLLGLFVLGFCCRFGFQSFRLLDFL